MPRRALAIVPAASAAALLLCLASPAAAQLLSERATTYDGSGAPTLGTTLGLTALALYDDPDVAEAFVGVSPERSPTAVLGAGARLEALALTPSGLLSLQPGVGSLLRLTSTALQEADVIDGIGRAVAAVDELGWLYVAHPLAGLVRLAVARPHRLLYAPADLAQAIGSPLPPEIVDLHLQDDDLLLAAGNDGLLAASRTGSGVERRYDVYADAEAAGQSGAEAFVVALAASPRGEPVVCVRAQGGAWVGVLTGAGLQPVGTSGPVVAQAPLNAGLAHVGGGVYLLATEDGFYTFDLTGNATRLLDAQAPLMALRAVGASTPTAGVVERLLDGCGGRALVVTEGGLLRATVGTGEIAPGDVLVALGGEQTLLGLVGGRDPVVLWEGHPLVEPTDLRLDPDGRLWIVDSGAQTVYRRDDAGELQALRGPGGMPLALAFDEEGRGLLVDLSLQDASGAQAPGVVRISPDGVDELVIHRGDPLVAPNHIVQDSNGSFVVSDPGASALWVLRNEANVSPVLLAEVEAPEAIAVAPDGMVYALSRPSTTQPALLRVEVDGSTTIVLRGEPLVQPTGLAALPSGALLVGDGRYDPFPAAAEGIAETGGLLSVDPDSGEPRPSLDSWLLPRSLRGIRLTRVPGDTRRDCLDAPVVSPPSQDPWGDPEADDEPSEGCAVGGAGSVAPLGSLLLFALLLGMPRATSR